MESSNIPSSTTYVYSLKFYSGTTRWFLLLRQKTKQIRDLLNNPKTYRDIVDGVKSMRAYANTSNKHNATFGTDDLNHGMLKKTIMDSSVGICAITTGSKHCDTPSDRWCASAIKEIEQEVIRCAFEEKAAGQLDIFKRLSRFPKKRARHSTTCTSYRVMTWYQTRS